MIKKRKGFNVQNIIHKSDIPARSDIETPKQLCRFLTDMILSVMTPTVILDPCSGDGNLTQFFDGVEVISYEKKQGRDFFDAEFVECDLVICNPPFNNDGSSSSRKLLPELFLKHILDVVPEGTPIVFITPHGLRHNVRKTSPRLEFLTTLNISSILTLPLDVFEGVLFHTEVLFINKFRLKSHYAYHPNTEFKNYNSNFKELEVKLNKFEWLEDKALLAACRTIAFGHGLQAMAGNLLAALIYKVDGKGYVTINGSVRDELALMLKTTEQVIRNNLKSLSDVNLIRKEGSGHYYYEPLRTDDCTRIISGDYQDISVELKFFKNDIEPSLSLTVR